MTPRPNAGGWRCDDREWAMITDHPGASKWLESQLRPGDVFLFNPR